MKEGPRTLEVKGRGRKWTVLYPAEDSLATPVPVYDREGNFKETIYAAGPAAKDKMTGTSFEGTYEEAVAYAHWLAPDCNIIKTTTKGGRRNGLKPQESKSLRDAPNPFLGN